MIIDKNVANTIYISLIMQLVTTVISLDGLNYKLEERDVILREIFNIRGLCSICRSVLLCMGYISTKRS